MTTMTEPQRAAIERMIPAWEAAHDRAGKKHCFAIDWDELDQKGASLLIGGMVRTLKELEG